MSHCLTQVAQRGCATVILSAICSAALASTRPHISMEDVVRQQSAPITDVRWLSDSSGLIADRAEPGGSQAATWTWRLRDGHAERIASGKYATISPNGEWLLLLENQQWKLKSQSNGSSFDVGAASQARKVVTEPPQWSADGRYVAIMESVRADLAERDESARTQVSLDDSSGVRVIDVGSAADGLAKGPYRSRITIVEPGRPPRPHTIELGDDAAHQGSWGTGDRFCFSQVHFWGQGDAPFTVVRCFDAASATMHEIVRFDNGLFQHLRPAMSPDGRWLALAFDIDNRLWDDFNSLVLLDMRTGEQRRLTTDLRVDDSYFWSQDGQSLYFTARNGGLSQIYRVTLGGQVTRITRDERHHYDFQISPDGQWLSYQTVDGYGRRDLRVASTRRAHERVVVKLSDPTKALRLGEFKQIRWRAVDGLEMFALLVLPPDFDPSRKYPLYVDIHGGGNGAQLTLNAPLTIRVAPGPLEWHAWAALGYVVLVPDFRSSGEYGPAPTAAMYRSRDWTGLQADVLDIESATRWMLDQGYIDRNRVAVFGHSAGGPRVNLLLTRSRLYSAGIIHDAVPSGPIGNLLSLTSGSRTGGALFEEYYKWTAAVSFEQDPQLYQRGFLFDGYRSTTPTLIMVGDAQKGAVNPQSSEILFSMLRHYKVPTRMLRYPDDGHVPWTPQSALHRFREIRAWLEKFAGPRDGEAR